MSVSEALTAEQLHFINSETTVNNINVSVHHQQPPNVAVYIHTYHTTQWRL